MDTAAGEFNICVKSGPHAVVTVVGDIDLAATGALVAAIAPLFDDHPATVTLDLKAVTFLDSSGLGALLTLQARCESAGAGLSTINAPHQVLRVLELTNLTDRFNLG